MVQRAVVVLWALVLMAACQLPGSPSSCQTTQIDWVNFIKVGSTQYLAGLRRPTPVLQEADLGPVSARVKSKVSGNICDPNSQPKDGDAAFLDAGTPIYQVTGQPPAGELAAHFNGPIVVYNVMEAAL